MHAKNGESRGKPPHGAHGGDREDGPADPGALAADHAAAQTRSAVPISEVLDRLQRAAAARDDDLPRRQGLPE
jgi:hypothetical protein